jgi:hypothetical protein
MIGSPLHLHAMDPDVPTSVPPELELHATFDDDDRARCLDGLWRALLEVRAEGMSGA